MTENPAPFMVVISGPNGSGKTTSAPRFLRDDLSVHEFVNADHIAHGLSAFNPDGVAIQAGKVMLNRLKELARQKKNFAFETTLASRYFAKWIREQKEKQGYLFKLIYLYLPFPELAKLRVQERVRAGGHHIPDHVIERRYHSGLDNFFKLYKPIADEWYLMDNSSLGTTQLIASGANQEVKHIKNHELWEVLQP
ncbi:MAG: Zeta toxin family protein [Acidobacteria bacterium]|nr:MAG: Zeta toxin family protein [Acidobacteriota bacterium]